jgi:hypothetical protein
MPIGKTDPILLELYVNATIATSLNAYQCPDVGELIRINNTTVVRVTKRTWIIDNNSDMWQRTMRCCIDCEIIDG